MSRNRRILSGLVALATGLLFSGLALADSALLQNPSAQDFVNALSSGSGVATRGLAPSGAGLPRPAQAQPSASVDIKFASNSVQVSPDAEQTLAELGKALQSDELANAHFAIVGHTDAKGNPAYNQKLSERRARAIKDYLVKKCGIAPARLQASGVGPNDLLDPSNPTSDVNRRVEIINKTS
jgi:OOP family OmpA-OmpF porin